MAYRAGGRLLWCGVHLKHAIVAFGIEWLTERLVLLNLVPPQRSLERLLNPEEFARARIIVRGVYVQSIGQQSNKLSTQ